MLNKNYISDRDSCFRPTPYPTQTKIQKRTKVK